MKKPCGAIIVAAGSAQRMEGIDKTMVPVGGVPMILRTVRALAASDKVDKIVVVTRKDLVHEVIRLCTETEKLVGVIEGGNTRTESVQRGLEALPSEMELVAIHDGARPLVTTQIIDEAICAAEEMGAAAPAIAVYDTIKRAENGLVLDTPDRSKLFAVQTPQVFSVEKITGALREAQERGLILTDDCSAAEAAGFPVRLTRGSTENMKVTTPVDLALAEAILQWRKDT